MQRLYTVPLVVSLAAGVLFTGCSKSKSDSTVSSATAVAESGPIIADFPSTDPSMWVNGAPMSLEKARGSVVLIEAWGLW